MSARAWSIQPYVIGSNDTALFHLWQTTIGEHWPLTTERLSYILSAPTTQHFVAIEDGQIIGFIGTLQGQRRGDAMGHISLLMVSPHRQRQGIGTALHETAIWHLQQAEVQIIQLGGGAARFWPGIPYNLDASLPFFQKLGWQSDHTVYDMTQNLRDYVTPPAIEQRMQQESIHIAPATSADVEEVLDFEKREFLGWYDAFKTTATMGDYKDLLVAREASGQVIGTLIMSSPQSHPDRFENTWRALLGEDMGTIGAVGVAESARGRGAGIAMVARASEIIKERGVGNCSIDWLVIVDFYAKLGYNIWKAYYMCSRPV